MSVGGRANVRGRVLRRAALIAAVLVLLGLLFLASGHWVLALIVGVAAAAAIWVFLQARTVR
jgi:low affinity Fe/Cu permease